MDRMSCRVVFYVVADLGEDLLPNRMHKRL